MNNIGARIVFVKATGQIILQLGEASGDGLSPYPAWGELAYLDIPYGSIDTEQNYISSIDPETLEPVLERRLSEQELREQLEAYRKEQEATEIK